MPDYTTKKEIVVNQELLGRAWKKFYAGDGLNDYELDLLIQETKKGYEYLSQRGPEFGLALKQTVYDLMKMEGWKKAREDDKKDKPLL